MQQSSLNPKFFWWTNDICLHIVDKFTLTIWCCECDDLAMDQLPIGSAEISRLPLFKTGHLDTSLGLMQLTEVRKKFFYLMLLKALDISFLCMHNIIAWKEARGRTIAAVPLI
jgi:hypothetical protein